MAGQLNHGSIKAMLQNEPCTSPVVQVIDIKRIQGNNNQAAERYRLVISDSIYYQQAMLATQLSHLITENVIVPKCLIRLNEYICNTIHGRRIIIILQVERLPGVFQANIGSPTNAEQFLSQVQGNGQAQGNAQQQGAPRQQNAPNRAGGARANQNGPASNEDPNAPGPIFPINSLNPYQNRWTIKARVTSKGEIRKWNNAKGSGKLSHVDLLDNKGGEIRATMFNDALDKFYDLFEVNKVFYISKGTLKMANKKYSSLKHEYEITLDQNAVVTPCQADVGDIPAMNYNFMPITEISRCQKDEVIDVLGVVVETGKSTSFTTKNNRETSRRNVTIVDMTSGTIELTFWGEKAENIKWQEEDHPVIALKGARVSDFNGKTLTTVSGTHVDVNPDITEAHALRGWYDSLQGSINYVNLSTSTYDASTIPDKRKVFGQIKDENLGRGEKPDYFKVKGTVSLIKHENPPWYNACPSPNCNKKVAEMGGNQYHCEKCGQTYSTYEPRYTTCVFYDVYSLNQLGYIDCRAEDSSLCTTTERYIISFAAGDYSGNTWLTAFNESGHKLLNHSAQTLATLKETNPMQYEKVFEDAIFKQFMFKVRAKEEDYSANDGNMAKRVKCNVMSVEPLDFVQESRWLIQQIAAYN